MRSIKFTQYKRKIQGERNMKMDIKVSVVMRCDNLGFMHSFQLVVG